MSRSGVASEGWLASNWRPMLMLLFGALVTCRWMGWSSATIPEAEAIKLWEIMEVSSGALVIGRSAEKIVPAIAEARGASARSGGASEGWLASNWRPMLMLLFGALIACRWMGWSSATIPEAEAIKLWAIMWFNMGAFVVGRSAEKIVPTLAELVPKR